MTTGSRNHHRRLSTEAIEWALGAVHARTALYGEHDTSTYRYVCAAVIVEVARPKVRGAGHTIEQIRIVRPERRRNHAAPNDAGRPARSRARSRGAGRPRVRAVPRAIARGGDSGDDGPAEPGEPAAGGDPR